MQRLAVYRRILGLVGMSTRPSLLLLPRTVGLSEPAQSSRRNSVPTSILFIRYPWVTLGKSEAFTRSSDHFGPHFANLLQVVQSSKFLAPSTCTREVLFTLRCRLSVMPRDLPVVLGRKTTGINRLGAAAQCWMASYHVYLPWAAEARQGWDCTACLVSVMAWGMNIDGTAIFLPILLAACLGCRSTVTSGGMVYDHQGRPLPPFEMTRGNGEPILLRLQTTTAHGFRTSSSSNDERESNVTRVLHRFETRTCPEPTPHYTHTPSAHSWVVFNLPHFPLSNRPWNTGLLGALYTNMAPPECGFCTTS